MKRIHALAIAATLSVAAVLGVSAATKTQTLGASARHASAATIAARAHTLDVFEASLKKALKTTMPRLPRVPVIRAATPLSAASPVASPAAAGSAPAPLVIYRRPAPIIIVKHRPHGDDGPEADGARRFGSGGHDD